MIRRPLGDDTPGARLVAEERSLLDRVRALLDRRRTRVRGVATDYDTELLELRDAVADTKPEDMPALVEQMARVASLAASRSRDAELPVDPGSPYFAHLRLREQDRTAAAGTDGRAPRVRDILIGRRGLIDRASGVQIVDWRDAPVSQIYYRYDEGDDYDEEVDRRHLVGLVEARRNVSIQHGVLRRVGCPQGTFVSDAAGNWYEAEGQAVPTLQGGSGKAARAPRSPRPASDAAMQQGRRSRRLGIQDGGPAPRADKHLPEIAALIDRHQFDLITTPQSGLVVIQGGAGSGKTTVALHRVAWLVFHDPQRFRPSRCLVIVPSQALERYVAGVLPALGVHGVPVVTARHWARSTRRKVLPALPDRYTDEAPAVVSRVKKHPALLVALERFVADKARLVGEALEAAVLEGASKARVRAAWTWLGQHVLVERLGELRRWIPGSGLDGAEAQRLELAITRLRRRARDVGAAWAEVMSDFACLRASYPAGGPDAVRDGELRETVAWVAAQQEDTSLELEGIDPEARAPVDGGELDDTPAGRAGGRLDHEDDPILLRLAQLLFGGLYKGGVRDRDSLIEYDHVAIDEAQDLSALEVKVLLDAAGRRRSVTIAGDTAQRLVFDNAFHGWDELIAEVDGSAGARDDARTDAAAPSAPGTVARLDGASVPAPPIPAPPATVIRPLEISYRSTAEVMRFARAILGPLAGPEQPARPGAPVELHRFEAMGEAVAFLADALRSLLAREPTASVALIARHPALADAWYQALVRAEVPSLRRVRRQDFPFTAGVDVTDVAQVKGLEFDYVVLLDVTAASYPLAVEARHLLHIGATRAAHQLWLISVGVPSPLVPPELLAEHAG